MATNSLRALLSLPPLEPVSPSQLFPLPLTFCVDLEFLFAIHRTSKLSPETLTLYSWLHSPKTSPTGPTFLPSAPTARESSPQLIWTQSILSRAGFDPVILADGSRHVDPKGWCLIQRLTLQAKGPGELLTKLRDRIIDPREWRVAGAVLQSRTLHAPKPTDRASLSHPSLREIKSHLEALQGPNTATTPWGVYANSTTGLQVHIGLDPQHSVSGVAAALPLRVLQHLCFILARFEDVISLLHPRHRRGAIGGEVVGHGGTVLKSNLTGLRGSADGDLPSLKEIHAILFSPDMTASKLARLMSGTTLRELEVEKKIKMIRQQRSANRLVRLLTRRPQKRTKFRPGRDRFVDFSALLACQEQDFIVGGSGGSSSSSGPGPRQYTLAFRQHRGSIDFREVGHWICFVLRLMRAAERAAREDTELGVDVERLLWWWDPGNGRVRIRTRMTTHRERLCALFDLLGLEAGGAERRYWWSRYREFNSEVVDGEEKGEKGEKEREEDEEEQELKCVNGDDDSLTSNSEESDDGELDFMAFADLGGRRHR